MRRRRRRSPPLLVILVVAAVAAVTAFQGGYGDGEDTIAAADPYAATVDHVVDGDTVVVRRGGREVTVRLVQIDAPESSSTRFGAPDACGPAATAFARTLTGPGDAVTVEPAGEDAQDRYGRTLAILHLGGPDARSFQLAMVRAGWAEPYVVGGNRTRILGALEDAADTARRERRGVWARCGGRFRTAGGT